MATKRPNGRWRVQVFIGTDENGKRKYRSFEADTKKAAEYAALIYKLGKGKQTKRKAITLRAAIQAYIESKSGILSVTTIRNYSSIASNFGAYLDIPIERINKVNLQTALNEYMLKGRKDGRGEIRSSKSVRNAYGLISAVLKQNDIDIGAITLPRKQEIEYATPFDNELKKIFEAVKGTCIEVPVLLATFCSLRRGEICGLRFSDVDHQKKAIRIARSRGRIGGKEYVKEPKTQKSKRVVYATDYILQLIRNLPHDSEEEYIFQYTPDYITKKFVALLNKHNLPRCRFHDLRHSFVSVLSAHGIDPLYIQTTGGWSSDQIMRSVYLQVSQEALRSQSEQANKVFEALMQPPATPKGD